MIPIHTNVELEVIRAEWELEYQKASLRRLAREARQARRGTSRHVWVSRVMSTIRDHLQSESRGPAIPEPLEVSCVDR